MMLTSKMATTPQAVSALSQIVRWFTMTAPDPVRCSRLAARMPAGGETGSVFWGAARLKVLWIRISSACKRYETSGRA